MYTQITKTINFLVFAPLAFQFWGEQDKKVPRAPLNPQFWGELMDASLFFSGDLGGGNAVNISQPDLCVHGSPGGEPGRELRGEVNIETRHALSVLKSQKPSIQKLSSYDECNSPCF